MTVDLEALEALAKAADSWGGWAIWPDLTEGGFVHVGNEDGVIPEGQIATPDDAEANPIAKAYTPEIGAFIAAADPSTVLALIAELQQERERADEAERRWHASVKRANEIVDSKVELVDALSRAEETIDRIDGEVKNFAQSDNDALCEIERLLTEYDKQKGADRG